MMKKRKSIDLPVGSKRALRTFGEPKIYKFPQGIAHIHVHGRRFRTRVLLDSGANVFVLNRSMVKELQIPIATRYEIMPLVGFDGTLLSGGEYYSQPQTLEMGNRHMSEVICEVADTGEYGIIIPFERWYKEHP